MAQHDDGRIVSGRTAIQAYARTAGLLIVISLIAGGFGESYVPSRLIVSGDAAATAANFRMSDFLFRLGFASYLVEAMCDITLALILYVLLRPVHKDLALLSAFLGLVGTTLFGVAELFYFSASFVLGGAGYLNTFSPDQLNTVALLLLKFYAIGGGLFLAFYGLAWIIRGYLILRSGYLPGVIGALMALGGLGFVVRNFAMVLAPAYPTGGLLLLMAPGGVLLAVWLLVKGVDVSKWEARVR